MLLMLEELPRRGAEWSGERISIGCNPDVIDLVVPAEVVGFDGPACQVTIGETVRFVSGDVDQIAKLVNACYVTEPDLRTFADLETPCEPDNSEDTESTSSSP